MQSCVLKLQFSIEPFGKEPVLLLGVLCCRKLMFVLHASQLEQAIMPCPIIPTMHTLCLSICVQASFTSALDNQGDFLLSPGQQHTFLLFLI